MQAIAIVALSILAAITYGILHDQITARVCIEYFTVAHPQVFTVPTASPTVLGFVWGVIATWWVGLGLGIPLAFAARFGRRPKKTVHDLYWPIILLLAITGFLALSAGVLGYLTASRGWIDFHGPLAARIPEKHHVRFLADLFAHSTSYAAGTTGGIILFVQTWRSRRAALL